MSSFPDDIILDDQNEKVKIQRVLISTCPRQLHVQMMKKGTDGGYDPARDATTGDPKFSLSTIVAYWPNWLTIMNDGHMLMCGCKTCMEMNDLHEAMQLERRKILSEYEKKLSEMPDGAEKSSLEQALNMYISQILNENGTHKHEDGWNVCEEYGCGERITVTLDNKEYSFPHFSCTLGECDKCDEADYQAPEFELSSHCQDRTIRYNLFTSHNQCTHHKAINIRYYDVKPKVRCGECEKLSEAEKKAAEEKKKRKAKIVKRVFRTIHSEPLSKFVQKKGTYAKHMKKMQSHKQRVRLLGSSHKKKTRFQHSKNKKHTWKVERDFSERMKQKMNKQAQFQYFGQEVTLGMEGMTVFFRPAGKDEFETHYYAILSTENEQDGNVVYANTRIMLEDIVDMIDNGTEIVGILPTDGLLEILEDTDGCSVQYRCGMALYLLHKLSFELDIVYDRAIDAEGHGKKNIDGYGGSDKTYMEAEFRSNVEYQPDAANPLKQSVVFSEMEDGKRKDFAVFCHEILARPERAGGSVPKVEAKNPRKTTPRKSETGVTRRKYVVRKKGSGKKWSGIKMQAAGFPKGKGNGLKFHYNFRFERALGRWFAYRRIPCSCKGCQEKLGSKSIDKRYSGPSNTCDLWKIFEKKDGSGEGLNDWKLARFEAAEDCNPAVYEACKADTLRETGKTWAKQVIEGNVGAYRVDDKKYSNYYLVKWEGEPQMAEETEEIQLEGNTEDTFTVNKGDWYCHGEWLDKLRGAKGWWTLTGTPCIVRLETLIMADVRVLERSEQNQLREGLTSDTVNKANESGAWKLSDIDHAAIIESIHDMSYLEYDEDLVEDRRDELVTETAWANNGDDQPWG